MNLGEKKEKKKKRAQEQNLLPIKENKEIFKANMKFEAKEMSLVLQN
jgi:hypothetical protein